MGFYSLRPCPLIEFFFRCIKMRENNAAASRRPCGRRMPTLRESPFLYASSTQRSPGYIHVKADAEPRTSAGNIVRKLSPLFARRKMRNQRRFYHMYECCVRAYKRVCECGTHSYLRSRNWVNVNENELKRTVDLNKNRITRAL